jgi:hypothetical protein
MGIVGMGASALGAGVSAIGAMETGTAQNTAYLYQSAVAQQQAAINLQESTREIMGGGLEAYEKGLKVAEQRGEQRVGFGAGNISVSSATPQRVMEGTTQQGQLAQQVIAGNAMNRAYRLQVAAASDEAQANLYKFEGAQAQTAGDIGATASILGGVGSVATKAMQFGQSFPSFGSSFFNAQA